MVNCLFRPDQHLKKKQAGVALLEKVSDDLDCMFFHLREYPELCVRGQGCSEEFKEESWRKILHTDV